MVEKVKGYGYKNIGFILNRGYFSKENLRFMDSNGFSFIIMVKGCKEFISGLVRKQKDIFESDQGNQISEFGVYGKTVHTFVYSVDTKKRYIHIYYNPARAAGERTRLEENIQEMQNYLARFQDSDHEFGPAFHKYFHLHCKKDSGHFVYGDPNLTVIRDELELCGYFAIITSERMDAKETIGLYKNRDVSEKVFRADKSYLGNGCLQVASEEAASNKIFIALIIRCWIYTALKNKEKVVKNHAEYNAMTAELKQLLDERYPKRSIEQKKNALYQAYVDSGKTLEDCIELMRNPDVLDFIQKRASNKEMLKDLIV